MHERFQNVGDGGVSCRGRLYQGVFRGEQGPSVPGRSEPSGKRRGPGEYARVGTQHTGHRKDFEFDSL